MVVLSLLPNLANVFRCLIGTNDAESPIGDTVEDLIMKSVGSPREAIEVETFYGISILRRNYRDYLPLIANHMDLATFAKFVRVSKVIKQISDCGIMKKRVSIKCYGTKNSEEGEDASQYLRVVYNGRTLSEDDVKHLIKAPWLVPQLLLLKADKSFLDWRFCPRKAVVEENMLELLEKLQVTRSDEVILLGNFDLDRLLEKVSTNIIQLGRFTSALRSDKLKQIEDVFIAYSRSTNDATTEAMNFILSASSTSIAVYCAVLPPSFVSQIVEMWYTKDKNFKYIQVEVRGDETFETFSNIRANVAGFTKFPVYGIEGDFENMINSSYEDTKKYANDAKGVIIYAAKDDTTFVIVREDSAMLRVCKALKFSGEDYVVVVEEIL